LTRRYACEKTEFPDLPRICDFFYQKLQSESDFLNLTFRIDCGFCRLKFELPAATECNDEFSFMMPNSTHCCRKFEQLAIIAGQPKHLHCSKVWLECEYRKVWKFTEQYSGQIPVHYAGQTQE
jgi:hypothetical protein